MQDENNGNGVRSQVSYLQQSIERVDNRLEQHLREAAMQASSFEAFKASMNSYVVSTDKSLLAMASSLGAHDQKLASIRDNQVTQNIDQNRSRRNWNIAITVLTPILTGVVLAALIKMFNL